MRPLRLLPTFSVLAALAGCGLDPTPKAVDEAAPVVAAARLPEVPTTALAPIAPTTRVVVTREEIAVDVAALFAGWPLTERDILLRSLPVEEARALPFVHRGLVRLDGWKMRLLEDPDPSRPEIRPVVEVLDYARTIELSHLDMVGTPPDYSFDASVYLDREAPYSLAVRVLHSAAISEHRPVIVVQGPQGAGGIPIHRPGYGGPRCLTTVVALIEEGIAVQLVSGVPIPALSSRRGDSRIEGADAAVARLNASGAKQGDALAALGGTAEELALLGRALGDRLPRRGNTVVVPGYTGRTIAAEGGGCPTIPKRGGTHDWAGLTALLRVLQSATPACAEVRVRAAAETPWSEIARVAAAGREAGFERLELTLPINPEEATGDCAKAITLEAIRAESLTFDAASPR